MNYIFLTLALLSITTFSQAGDLTKKIRQALPETLKDLPAFQPAQLNLLDARKKICY